MLALNRHPLVTHPVNPASIKPLKQIAPGVWSDGHQNVFDTDRHPVPPDGKCNRMLGQFKLAGIPGTVIASGSCPAPPGLGIKSGMTFSLKKHMGRRQAMSNNKGLPEFFDREPARYVPQESKLIWIGIGGLVMYVILKLAGEIQ